MMKMNHSRLQAKDMTELIRYGAESASFNDVISMFGQNLLNLLIKQWKKSLDLRPIHINNAHLKKMKWRHHLFKVHFYIGPVKIMVNALPTVKKKHKRNNLVYYFNNIEILFTIYIYIYIYIYININKINHFDSRKLLIKYILSI